MFALFYRSSRLRYEKQSFKIPKPAMNIKLFLEDPEEEAAKIPAILWKS
jgi:carbon monoxide dehydrogenase subunit G